MAQQRTVAVGVKLLAQDYFAGLKKMQEETKKTSTTAEQAFNKQKAAFTELGHVALGASVVFTGAFVAMVKASADFEQRMSQVQALSKATAGQMDKLRGSAFTAGKAFGLSATQVADAEIELTKAGVSVRDIIGGALPGALALAAAGQLDVAKATEIAANAMTIFKLQGKDLPHVADLLAASADKSVASVGSVGDALNQSGLVAHDFGLSVDQTVGVLTAFSKNALNGSDAGTSLKNMFTQLAAPSQQAEALLKKYNITGYDSQGVFVGVTKYADQLRAGLGTLSDQQRQTALTTIFGTDAYRAANVLYKEGGKSIQGYIDANNEAGFAALQASKKLDNLNGDVQKLGASFQNDLIKSGSAANDILRGVTKGATGLLDVFGDLPKPIEGTALAVTAVGAATTAAGAAFLLLTPKIAETKLAMAELNITGKGLAAGFVRGGVLALGLASVTSALAATGQTGETTAKQLDAAARSAKTGYSNLNGLFKGDAFNGISGAGDALKASFSGDFSQNLSEFTKHLDGATFGLTHFSDTYKTNEGQFKALGEQLGALANQDYSRATTSFNGLVQQLGGGKEVAQESLKAFPAYREAIDSLLKSSGQAITDQNRLAAASGRGGVADAIREAQAQAQTNAQTLQTMAGSAADASVDISTLSKTIAGFGSATLDARSAERAFHQAVDDATAAAKNNAGALNKNRDAFDDTTKAGRDHEAALDGIASAATNAASKILEETGSQGDATKAIKDGREAFIRAATQMGLTRTAAKKLADQLGLIPSNVDTAVGITGYDAAKADLARLKELVNGIPRFFYINPKVVAPGTGTVLKKAAGGSVAGSGAKGVDSVPAILAPGEHVFTAKDVDRMGGQGAVYAFRKGLQAYANGGAVNGITAQQKAAQAADAAAKRYAVQLKTAKSMATRADKTYEAIDGTKKNAAAKKAAKARSDAASKKVDDLQKKLDDARQKRTDATSAAAALRNDREDFVSGQRRATADNPTDPLSYVDQLRSMSRDDNYTGAAQKSYKDAANQYEKSLVDLATKSAAAAKTLDDLKSSADSMRSGIVSSITGQYGLGGISSTQSTSTGSIMRNGISFTTSSTSDGYSAGGIDAYYAKGASSTAAFASQLQQLANRGVDGRFLAEIAQDSNGPKLATALLSGTSGQLASINTNYAAIQGNAASAAGTVTDYNYKALIDSAQANSDSVTATITSEGEKLRKLIASAFGLTGYAVGTMSASPGLHLVGENGPELVTGPGFRMFRGGEQVANAARTRSMIAAAQSRPGSTVVNVHVSGDDSILASAMSVVADRRIAADQMQDVVLEWGKGA